MDTKNTYRFLITRQIQIPIEIEAPDRVAAEELIKQGEGRTADTDFKADTLQFIGKVRS